MIKVKSIALTCTACPSQFEGLTEDNRKLYFRYRFGRLTVEIGAKDDMSEFAALRGERIYSISIGDEYDGYMDLEELKGHTMDVLYWNDPLEEFVPEEYPPTEAEKKLLGELGFTVGDKENPF
jgi:hypothetical protein